MAKNVRSLVGMLFFWIAWTGITGLGWTVTLVTIAAFSFSSAVWDPDEVEYYLNTTPFERIAEAMLGGVVFGIIGGLVVGILLWIVHKRVKGALLMAAGTLVGTALLCGIAGSGGPASEVSEFSTVFRGAVVGGVLGGVLSGFGQWVLLRHNIKVASGWIVWTIAGWAVGWVVIMSLPELILGGIAEGRLSLIGNLAVAFIAGAIAGEEQWRVLRENVSQSGWYVLASAIGWSAAFAAIESIRIPGFFTGIAIGGIPGAMLVFLISPRDINFKDFQSDSTMEQKADDGKT